MSRQTSKLSSDLLSVTMRWHTHTYFLTVLTVCSVGWFSKTKINEIVAAQCFAAVAVLLLVLKGHRSCCTIYANQILYMKCINNIT